MAIERHFIQEGVIRSEIESYLKNELNRAGYSGINIQKTPLSTRVILYVEKPPIVIGKKGRRINTLTHVLNERFGIENPSIDVQKIERPTLDPNIIARRIAVALERGMNRRRVAYKAVRAVMGSGARGVMIILSGKIVGKGGRSRTEKYSEGYMKNAGDSAKLVRVGSTQAFLKAGVIGVTAKIVPPGTRFPDQIEVLKPDQVIDIDIDETKKVKKVKTKKAPSKKAPSKKEKKPAAEKADKKKVEQEKVDKTAKKDQIAEKAEPVKEKQAKEVMEGDKNENQEDSSV